MPSWSAANQRGVAVGCGRRFGGTVCRRSEGLPGRGLALLVDDHEHLGLMRIGDLDQHRQHRWVLAGVEPGDGRSGSA